MQNTDFLIIYDLRNLRTVLASRSITTCPFYRAKSAAEDQKRMYVRTIYDAPCYFLAILRVHVN
jgi:hypothetical protein